MLRDLGVSVHVAENELPEIDDVNDRLVEIARRLGLRLVTCSASLKEQAKRRGIAVTDLRPLADDLTPDHPPGEQLVIDLVREGDHPRQAVGYLSSGDMVVVNDAAHMIGREDVVIEVLSTRRTSQGLLVFGQLAQRPHGGGPFGTVPADGADRSETLSRDRSEPGPVPSDERSAVADSIAGEREERPVPVKQRL